MTDEKWVWPYGLNTVNAYADFVHKFNVVENFKKVNLIIRADNQYAVWINGKFVDYGQYPDYPYYTVYDCIDISPYLISGNNRLCVLGYCQVEPSSTYFSGTPGIRFRIECDGKIISGSGKDTLCRQDPCYKSGYIPKISGQLSFGFICNSRNYDNWLMSDVLGFEMPECRENASEPVMRKIKKPQLMPVKPSALIASGSVMADLEDEEIGRRMQYAEWDGKCSNGIYMLFDLSEESAGLLTVKTVLSKATRIDIAFGEHIVDGRVRSYIPPRNFAVEYIAQSGSAEFTHYMKRIGARYLQVYAYCEKEDIISLETSVKEVQYPVSVMPQPTGLSANEKHIYDIGVRTLRLCMHEHYEDTPWREQALYAMDARNQILCGYHAFGEYNFAKENLRLLGLGMRKDGLLELCAPAQTGVTIPSFSLIYIVSLYEYLIYSGDICFIKEMTPIIEHILFTTEKRMCENGLIDRFIEPQFWNFYEWSENLDGGVIDRSEPLEKGKFELPLNAFFVAAAYSAYKLFEATGIDKSEWLDKAIKTADAINRYFYDDQGFYYDFVIGKEKSGKSQLSNALAIWCGACNTAKYPMVCKVLTEQTDAVKVTLSSQIFRYEALLRSEIYGSSIKKDILNRWLPMIDAGATSFWETEKGESDFDGAGSLCHGWSAVPVYFYHLLYENRKPVFNPEEITSFQ